MRGTNKKRHDLGAGFAAWTYTAPDGTERIAIAQGGIPKDAILWDGELAALRRVMDAIGPERKALTLPEVLAATTGTQFGAIIRCAYDLERDARPRFTGKASVTSDGFVMCSFVDKRGEAHSGAFVGSADDLEHNIAGLIAYCKMSADEAKSFRDVMAAWIGDDWRPGKGKI